MVTVSCLITYIDGAERNYQKQVLCMSIMMHSTNQQCNSYQTMVRIFLHSCNAPQTVMELLLHLSLSIGSSTICQATRNLSNEAGATIQTLRQGLLTLCAYDNLDIDFKPSIPTAKKPQDTLVHLTMGTVIPLHPDIKSNDLNCSDELWNKYYRNSSLRRQDLPPIPFYNLYKIHSKQPHVSGLTQHQRYQVYKYCTVLGQNTFVILDPILRNPRRSTKYHS
jgi:hypothetical protein